MEMVNSDLNMVIDDVTMKIGYIADGKKAAIIKAIPLLLKAEDYTTASLLCMILADDRNIVTIIEYLKKKQDMSFTIGIGDLESDVFEGLGVEISDDEGIAVLLEELHTVAMDAIKLHADQKSGNFQ